MGIHVFFTIITAFVNAQFIAISEFLILVKKSSDCYFSQSFSCILDMTIHLFTGDLLDVCFT